MESLCRVCLLDKKEETTKIEFVSIFENKNICFKLMECAKIIISIDDLLPKEICTLCAQKLNMLYEFKIQCEESHRHLVNLTREKLQINNCSDEEFHETDEQLIFFKQESDASSTENNECLNLVKCEEINRKHEIKLPQKQNLKNINPSCVELSSKVSTEPIIQALAGSKEKTAAAVTNKNRKSVIKYIKKNRSKFICEQCGRIFTSQSSLLGHKRRHKGEKMFVCSTCGKSFFILSELKNHSNIHKSVKPYQCKYCERRFADWGSRLKHERRHRGERPYTCDVCSKSFLYSYVLTRHKKTHNKTNQISCSLCPKRFSIKHDLKRHVKKDHDPVETEGCKKAPIILETKKIVKSIIIKEET